MMILVAEMVAAASVAMMVADLAVDKGKWLGGLQNTENFKIGTKENGLNHILMAKYSKVEGPMVIIMKGCQIVTVKLSGMLTRLMSWVSIRPI